MTTPTPRWTAETAELARATAFDAMACAPWPPPDEETVLELIEAGELPETYDREAAEHYAEMYVAEQVLAVLADAGVLIPVGGETRQEIERAGFRRGWTERDRAMVIGRCWSCDHESAMHQPDGCWYAVTNGTVGQNSVCACSEPKPREVTDDPA